MMNGCHFHGELYLHVPNIHFYSILFNVSFVTDMLSLNTSFLYKKLLDMYKFLLKWNYILFLKRSYFS